MENYIIKEIINKLRSVMTLELYALSYPLVKSYFNQKANRYASRLVKMTETPNLLKEPIDIIPSRKNPSSVVASEAPKKYRELFEKESKKRRVYIDYTEFFLGNYNGSLVEEVSHEIRERHHHDSLIVAEFFGMVGRILSEGPKINVPTVEWLEKRRDYRKADLWRITRQIEEFRYTMENWDDKTLIEQMERAKLDKRLIQASRRVISYPKMRERLEKLLILHYFATNEAIILSDLAHFEGYLAAVRNKKSIKENPKGIYLLDEEEVKRKYFQN